MYTRNWGLHDEDKGYALCSLLMGDGKNDSSVVSDMALYVSGKVG